MAGRAAPLAASTGRASGVGRVAVAPVAVPRNGHGLSRVAPLLPSRQQTGAATARAPYVTTTAASLARQRAAVPATVLGRKGAFRYQPPAVTPFGIH